MALVFYTMSGSPYGWRVALALEHKGLAYEQKLLSYDAGDLRGAEFARLNPRRKVPVIVDGDFVLYESAAILEYLDEVAPDAPRLFALEPRPRAIQRRMIAEADAYVGTALDRLVKAALFTPNERRSKDKIGAAAEAVGQELARWDEGLRNDFLTGALSAADFALFPQLALVRRITQRNPGLLPAGLIGPALGLDGPHGCAADHEKDLAAALDGMNSGRIVVRMGGETRHHRAHRRASPRSGPLNWKVLRRSAGIEGTALTKSARVPATYISSRSSRKHTSFAASAVRQQMAGTAGDSRFSNIFLDRSRCSCYVLVRVWAGVAENGWCCRNFVPPFAA